MKRRTFLKGIIAIGVGPTLLVPKVHDIKYDVFNIMERHCKTLFGLNNTPNVRDNWINSVKNDVAKLPIRDYTVTCDESANKNSNKFFGKVMVMEGKDMVVRSFIVDVGAITYEN